MNQPVPPLSPAQGSLPLASPPPMAPFDPSRELGAPEPEIHLADYLRIVQERWRLIALLTAVCALLGFVSYLVTPKLYSGTTTILIERRLSVPVKNAAEGAWENYYNIEFYPTQYKLLQSRGLAERVVQNLRLDQDPLFNPGRAALAATAAGSAAADEAALGALAGRVLGGLAVNPGRTTQMVDITFVSTSPELAARVANGVAETYIDWGIETRSALAGKASVFYGSQVEAIKQEIQDKENQLVAYSRRNDIVTLDSGGNVVLSRLESLNQDLAKAASERIGKGARLAELQAATEESAAEILDDTFVVQLRTELISMERDYSTRLNTYKPEWPAMVELKTKIETARRNLKQAARDALEKARESARADYQTAQRREGSLTAEINQLKAENRTINSAAIEYNNLKVEISTRRALLDDLLRQQSSTDVTSRLQATRESNVRVVDRALVPGGPFRPSLRRNLSLGGGVGLLLGLGLAFLLHYMDRTVKTSEQVERELGIPVLAVVPDIASATRSYGYGLLGRYGGAYGYGYGYGTYGYGATKGGGKRRPIATRTGKPAKSGDEDTRIELVPHLRPRLPVSEAYRALRTALLLSSARELRVVVVTSAVPGEGKTSTAANLAVVLSQLGKQVLLVDGDLRKPRLHEVFKASNRSGLVNVLTGSAEPEKTIFRTEIPNLFFTPSGPTPPNPSELLSSERMRDFVNLARSRFDIVLIDSAPVLAVTDSTLLGSMSDGVVLCLCVGYVLRQDARACRDRLGMADVRILGAVLNRFRIGAGTSRGGYSSYQAYAAAGYGDEEAVRGSRKSGTEAAL